VSYDFTIGDAFIYLPNTEYGYELEVGVKGATSPDAPSFPGDTMTGQTSTRSPSYSGWSDFAVKTRLYGLFYDKDTGLIAKHPGTFMLTPKHAYVINSALRQYVAEHPNAKPGWCGCKECDNWYGKDVPHQQLDGNLARLMWLDWWVKWALANCKIPAIRNT
jgi:hypothetical protein